MTIGDRIRSIRIEKGLSQVELANRAGLSKQTLYKYEQNVVTNIPSDKIEAIANGLMVSPAVLMGWPEKKESSYYTDPETAKMAQQLHDDPNLRLLFDAARDAKPEDLQMAAQLLLRFKETNNE